MVCHRKKAGVVGWVVGWVEEVRGWGGSSGGDAGGRGGWGFRTGPLAPGNPTLSSLGVTLQP